MDFEKYVNKALDELGIPCNLLGRKYLVDAIKLYHENPRIKICQLYKDVAVPYDTTGSKVERAIRHSIERGFDNCTPDCVYEYFGNTISPNNGKPMNKQFIARICYLYDMEVKK